MMQQLPQGVPTTLQAAFQYIAGLDAPSIDDLKVMVMLEAAGLKLYEDLASGTDRHDVREILLHNGREELAHAHRVSKVIGKLTGQPFPVPAPDENPYLVDGQAGSKALTGEALHALAEAELNGNDLYERWASNCPDPEAAALLRQNGREELEHGSRLQAAATLLAA